MTILLITHIILMSFSMISTAIVALVALISRKTPRTLDAVNVFTTMSGVLFGIILLIQNPVGSKCLTLVSYIAAFAAVRVYTAKRHQPALVSEL